MNPLMRKDEIVRHVYHDYDCYIQNLMVKQLNRYSEQEFESFVKKSTGMRIEIVRKNTYFVKL